MFLALLALLRTAALALSRRISAVHLLLSDGRDISYKVTKGHKRDLLHW